ncbi:MAG: hypothetical protein OEM46_11405 [Ignavibacteria bacterium]|nr:hypothetical protein [Ignavibacteria bacterium]
MFSSKGNQYLLFILTSLVIYNCSESTEPDNSISELIPLKIGNTWNYNRTVYDSTGAVIYDENITSTVEKDTTINGIEWFDYNDVPAGIWFTNKSTGYWAFVNASTGNFLNDTSFIVYKFPTQVGDLYDIPGSTVEVIAIDEIVLVPAGKFKIIHLVSTYPSPISYLMDSFEIFIAPGVGIIKRMQIGKKYDGTKFIVFTSELESYSIK